MNFQYVIGFLVLIFGFCVSICSCNRQESKSLAPQIDSVITIGQHHANTLHGFAGTQNSFEVYSSDDNGLLKLRCTLENPSDGLHAHVSLDGAEALVFLSPNIGVWEDSKSFDITGLTNSTSVKFDAPSNLSGMWILEMQVIDVDGNMSHEHYELMIENDSIPRIVPGEIAPQPGADGVIYLNPGGIVELEGFILDEDGLNSIQIVIEKNEVVIWQQEWTNYNNNAFNLAQVNFPALNEQGRYQLILRGTDNNGWQNWQQAYIEVE